MKNRVEVGGTHCRIALESDIEDMKLHLEADHMLTWHVNNLTQESIKEIMIVH